MCHGQYFKMVLHSSRDGSDLNRPILSRIVWSISAVIEMLSPRCNVMWTGTVAAAWASRMAFFRRVVSGAISVGGRMCLGIVDFLFEFGLDDLVSARLRQVPPPFFECWQGWTRGARAFGMDRQEKCFAFVFAGRLDAVYQQVVNEFPIYAACFLNGADASEFLVERNETLGGERTKRGDGFVCHFAIFLSVGGTRFSVSTFSST